MRNLVTGVAGLSTSMPVFAQHGPPAAMGYALVIAFYVVLCLISVPLAFLGGGSTTKRIIVGLTAPIISIALGIVAVEMSGRLFPNDMGLAQVVFLATSILPLLCWGAWLKIRSNLAGKGATVHRLTITAISLVALLVISNAWWAFRTHDQAADIQYCKIEAKAYGNALDQAVAVMPVIAKDSSDRAAIVSAAQRVLTNGRTFEKDGFVWVGPIGFKFGPDKRLTEARTLWSH